MSKEENPKVDRRKFLKYGVGGVVVVGAAAAAGYGIYETGKGPTAPGATPTVTAPGPTTVTAPGPTTAITAEKPVTIRWMDSTFTIRKQVMDEFMRRYPNVTMEPTIVDYGTAIGKAITGGPDLHKEYDVCHVSTDHSALVWPIGTYEMGIDRAKLPRTADDKNYSPFFWKDQNLPLVSSGLTGPHGGRRLAEYLWNDAIEPNVWMKGEVGKKWLLHCTFYSMDSVAFNPESVTPDPHSWEAILDPQYKGKASIQDFPTISINEWGMYLIHSEQFPGGEPEDGPAPNQLNEKECFYVTDFLKAHGKRGQFRTLWPDYGYATSLHITREIVISDLWAPGVFDTRRGDTPCKWAEPDEGYRVFISGELPTAGIEDPYVHDWVYRFIDFRNSGWMGAFQANIAGYTIPAYVSDEVKKEMGPENYDWAFNGKRTYKPWTELPMPVPVEEERIAQAMFIPELYPWSREAGTEDPTGNAKDGGSMEKKHSRVATVQLWPNAGSKWTEAWTDFKAAIG